MIAAKPATATITLRPYQPQTIDAIGMAWDDGARDVLAVLATGAGKTAIFLALIDEILLREQHTRAGRPAL